MFQNFPQEQAVGSESHNLCLAFTRGSDSEFPATQPTQITWFYRHVKYFPYCQFIGNLLNLLNGAISRKVPYLFFLVFARFGSASGC